MEVKKLFYSLIATIIVFFLMGYITEEFEWLFLKGSVVTIVIVHFGITFFKWNSKI
ncbi:hypothetical protein [Bacillus sp. AK128]